MWSKLLAPFLGVVDTVVDKLIPDKGAAQQLKAEIALQAMRQDESELKGAVSVILAEASGESWLQRNWRPLLMLWFAALVGAHWLGYTPDNLSDDTISDLLGIVKVGIGGYVMGRSGEKIMKAYRSKL